MKQHCDRHTAAVLALLLASSVWISHANVGNARASSFLQVQDTLHNLLRSIDDAGDDAEALSLARQPLCEGALQRFKAMDERLAKGLKDARARITEADAEVEEASGTVGQIKVDIEMVRHTIKQTEDMLKHHRTQEGQQSSAALSSLLESKQLSLTTLQGQLDMTVPTLSRLQANVAEMRQRVSRRAESVDASKDFVAALTDECDAAATRAETQAYVRRGESNSIHVALQSLGDTMQSFGLSIPFVTPPAPDALSFLQVDNANQAVSLDNLQDIFKHRPGIRKSTRSALRASRTKALQGSAATTAGMSRVSGLLTQLKSMPADFGMDQEAWCAKQRQSGELALKFARDSVARVTSESNAHSDIEAEIAEELKTLEVLAVSVKNSTELISQQLASEESLLQKNRKDEELAMKILEQASAILKELDVTNATKVFGALESTKKTLAAELRASVSFEQEASAKAQTVTEKAEELARVQQNEQQDLELAQDDHASQRLRDAASLRLYEADSKEAAAYMQELEESCKADVSKKAKQQYSAQVHALEDSDKALQGKLTAPAPRQGGLRGRETTPALKNLTPMQRAAMEMGVPLEE